ncbi:Hypothetical protein POVN_LOCUS6 [uncultured virus]|nr:Hypothetical protein POVN_LOCUS6 [uncultured virus]
MVSFTFIRYFLIITVLIASLVRAVCTSVLITNDAAYAALNTTVRGCTSISTLTFRNLSLTRVELGFPATNINFVACPALAEVKIVQPLKVGPITSQVYTYSFKACPKLAMYDLRLSNNTFLQFDTMPYPTQLGVNAPTQVEGLIVTNVNWEQLTLAAPFVSLDYIILSNLPNMTDLSAVADKQPTGTVFMSTLPRLRSIAVASTTLNFLSLYGLPLVTTLGGFSKLARANTLHIRQMAGLRDISALGKVQTTTIMWTGIPPVCYPAAGNALYTWSQSKLPSFKNCLSITNIIPNDGPITGGSVVHINYTGAIRMSTILVRFGPVNITCQVGVESIVCTTPPGSPGNTRLTYTLGNITVIPEAGAEIGFLYKSWDEWATLREERDEYLTTQSSDRIPTDRSADVNTTYMVVWGIVGVGSVVAAVLCCVFGLPLWLDRLRTPYYIGIDDKRLTATKQTQLGVWMTIVIILLIGAGIISLIVPFVINNNLITTSLVAPGASPPEEVWQAVLRVQPANLCEQPDFQYSAVGFAVMDGVTKRKTSGTWDRVIDNGTCTLTWRCEQCMMQLQTADITLTSTSSSAYVYWIEWSLATGVGYSVAGLQAAIAGALLDGMPSITLLVTPWSTRIAGTSETHTTLMYAETKNVQQRSIDTYGQSRTQGLTLHIAATTYWKETLIQAKQGLLDVVAKIFGLFGILKVANVLLMLFAPKRMDRRKLSVDTRRKTIDQPPIKPVEEFTMVHMADIELGSVPAQA